MDYKLLVVALLLLTIVIIIMLTGCNGSVEDLNQSCSVSEGLSHVLFDKYPHMKQHFDPRGHNKIEKMFKDVVPVLNKYNINYWCMYGTLLGLHRDGYILPWDYDIDFAIEDIYVDKLLNNKDFLNDIEKVGLSIKKSKNNTLKLYKTVDIPPGTKDTAYLSRKHIDIYVLRSDGTYIGRGCFFDWSIKCNPRIQRHKFKIDDIYPLKKVFLKNYGFPVNFPHKVDTLLRHNYGNWTVPKYTHS